MDNAIGTVQYIPLLCCQTAGPRLNLNMPWSNNNEILETEEYVM